MEKKLAGRLEAGLKAWNECLKGKQDEGIDHSMDTDAPTQTSHKPGGEPKIKVSAANAGPGLEQYLNYSLSLKIDWPDFFESIMFWRK